MSFKLTESLNCAEILAVGSTEVDQWMEPEPGAEQKQDWPREYIKF